MNNQEPKNYNNFLKRTAQCPELENTEKIQYVWTDVKSFFFSLLNIMFFVFPPTCD